MAQLAAQKHGADLILADVGSLVPMAQEVRKPIFHLTTADGAIGSHSYAVTDARKDFMTLAQTILEIGWSA